MTIPRSPVPDLLKRFVPTSYKFAAKGVVIETNDLDLLEMFDDPLALSEFKSGFQIRIIREPAAQVASEALCVLQTEELAVLLFGSGTRILVDREQQRIFAFVTPDVTNENLVTSYLPLAMRPTTS
jgi:hypothetical protein